MLFNLNQEEKIDLLKKAYEKECVVKAKDLAYNILRLEKEIEKNKEKIVSIKKEIKETLNNIPHALEQKYIDAGIKDILDDSIKND